MSRRLLSFAVLAALAAPAVSLPAEAGMVFIPLAKQPPGWRGSPRPVAVAPTPAPSATPAMVEASPATVRVSTRTWVLPRTAGSGAFDFSFSRPTWLVNAVYWRGRWGLGLEAIAFNTTYAPFRPEPYFQATTPMIEGQLRHRWTGLPLELQVGLRSLGQADLVFGTAGAAWRQPLPLSGLSVLLDGRVGHNLQGSFLIDAEAGLSYRLRGVSFELGFRQLALQAAGDPFVLLNGPTMGLGFRF